MEKLFRIKISGYGTKENLLKELDKIRSFVEAEEDSAELEQPSLFAEIHETTEEQEEF